MPVRLKRDSKGTYAQEGNTGAKYYYKAGDKEERNKAKQKAYIQEYAVKKSQERRGK